MCIFFYTDKYFSQLSWLGKRNKNAGSIRLECNKTYSFLYTRETRACIQMCSQKPVQPQLKGTRALKIHSTDTRDRQLIVASSGRFAGPSDLRFSVVLHWKKQPLNWTLDASFQHPRCGFCPLLSNLFYLEGK